MTFAPTIEPSIAPRIFARDIGKQGFGNSQYRAALVDFPGEFHAISIGPESDFDRATIWPANQIETVRQLMGGNGPSDFNPLWARGFKIGVGAPWIGHIQGPFYASVPYVRSIDLSGTLRSFRPTAVQLWGTGSVDSESIGQVLQLVFHRCPPTIIPWKRPPAEYVGLAKEFGAAGTADQIWRFPMYGRKRFKLALEMTGRSAGSINWTVTAYDDATATNAVKIGEVLQATTTEAADFERHYDFDGECDYIELRVQENAALNAGVTVQCIAKTFDD